MQLKRALVSPECSTRSGPGSHCCCLARQLRRSVWLSKRAMCHYGKATLSGKAVLEGAVFVSEGGSDGRRGHQGRRRLKVPWPRGKAISERRGRLQWQHKIAAPEGRVVVQERGCGRRGNRAAEGAVVVVEVVLQFPIVVRKVAPQGIVIVGKTRQRAS